MTPTELRQIRKDRELTQRQLGDLLGYTANYISRLERGDEEITERFERLLRHIVFPLKAKKYTKSV